MKKIYKMLWLLALLAVMPVANVVAQNVAKIGDTGYATLKAAVSAAADGATITLIADDNSLSDGSELEINKSLTITGAVDSNNGEPLYTISGKSTVTGTNDIFITGSGTVTLSNLKIQNFGNSASTDIGHAPIYVSSNFTGTVNLVNLYVSNFNRGGMFLYGGTFNVDGCYIDCANSTSGAFTKGIEIKGTASGTIQNTSICNMERSSQAYSCAGIEIYGNGSVVVDDCTIESNNGTHSTAKATFGIVTAPVGAYDPSGGSLQVTDCVFSCTNGCLSIEANNYDAVLNDCSFDNYIATYAATTAVTINSGDYAEDVYADAGTITINGGEFSRFVPAAGTNGSIVINGGTFDADPTPYVAEGVTVSNEGGVYSIQEVTYVAQIGDVKYETLAEAIAAVPTNGTETTITMIADEAVVAGVTIAAGQNVVLELNGKTISGNTESNTTYALITNRGTLTIQDNTDTNKDGTGTGLITTYISNPDGGNIPGYASNTITNNGTLTVKSGKIVNNGNGYACYAIDNQTNGNLYSPVLNIEGGRMEQMNARTYAVRMFCNSTTNTNSLSVSGGVITGGYGLWLQTPNASANMASLNITGGTIEARDGAALYIGGTKADNSEISVDIEGGTIGGTGVIIQGPLSGTYGHVSISGGEIENVQCGANVEKFISGGTFKSDPNATYIAEGAASTANGDGTYTVGQAPVAQIGETKYFSLAEAVAAAQNGETVTLLADVTLTDRLFVNAGATPAYAGTGNRYATTTENKSITLDMNGHNITSSSNIALAGGSLNITNNGTADATHGVISTSEAGLAPVEIRGTGDLTQKRTLTVGEGVTLTGSTYGLNVFGSNNSDKNIIDVNVNGTVNGTVFVLGNLKNAANEININVNGTIYVPDNGDDKAEVGIALNGYATVTVNNGANVSGETGIEVRAGKLIVNGGTITATASTYSEKKNSSGSSTKGAAIAVVQHTTNLPIATTLSGGTLNGVEKLVIADVEEVGLNDVAVTATTSYTQQAEIPEGYEWKDNGDGTSTFVKKTEYIFTDGTDTYTIASTVEGVTATYKRTFDASAVGMFKPWMVPFDYKLTATDVENFDFYEINKVEFAESGNTTKMQIRLSSAKAEGAKMEANMPYIYMPKSSAVGEYSFKAEGVTLTAADGTSVRKTFNVAEGVNVDFYSVYEKTKPTDAAYIYYMGKSGKIAYSNNANTTFAGVGPFRWIFKVSGAKAGSAAYTFGFANDDDDLTAVSNATAAAEGEVVAYYTLSGQKVSEPTKGVYVVKYANGTSKKVVF